SLFSYMLHSLSILSFSTDTPSTQIYTLSLHDALPIWATIALALLAASTLPCGSKASWLTLADTNNMAEPFLQAATQAPQPMHDAASIASSAASLGIGIAFASGTPPVLTETYPPAIMILSNAERSTIRSLITGNAAERQGSIVITSPSLNLRMCNWQVVTPSSGPCG